MIDRLEPCKYYSCEGNCSKGREGTFKKYCQRCKKYVPRARVKHPNEKKQKLNKIKEKEVRKEYLQRAN